MGLKIFGSCVPENCTQIFKAVSSTIVPSPNLLWETVSLTNDFIFSPLACFIYSTIILLLEIFVRGFWGEKLFL